MKAALLTALLLAAIPAQARDPYLEKWATRVRAEIIKPLEEQKTDLRRKANQISGSMARLPMGQEWRELLAERKSVEKKASDLLKVIEQLEAGGPITEDQWEAYDQKQRLPVSLRLNPADEGWYRKEGEGEDVRYIPILDTEVAALKAELFRPLPEVKKAKTVKTAAKKVKP